MRIVGRCLGLLCVLAPLGAMAQPVLTTFHEVDGVKVFPDLKNKSLYYYAPGKLAIARMPAGEPEISFLQMVYVGTQLTGDQGLFQTRSILSFRVKMEGLGADRVKTTKAKLEGELNKTIQLRPLAIRKLETTLQYTPVREETPTTPAPEPTTVGTGNMENEAPESNGEYWTQRTYTLYPDNETSQLLWSAFEKGQVALSLSYTFFANGVESSASGGTATGNIPPPEADGPPEPKVMAVNGDVVNVTVDGLKERSRFKRIDINQSVPANYAALRLYCFDFNNELREDLYQKTVEIRATSVAGKRILESVAFAKTTPDITSASLKFKFAIDLKKPYEYRVRQVLLTGEEKVGSWKTVKNWNQILDVTTPKEELPKKPEDPPRKLL